jgi:hypothetical protein
MVIINLKMTNSRPMRPEGKLGQEKQEKQKKQIDFFKFT